MKNKYWLLLSFLFLGLNISCKKNNAPKPDNTVKECTSPPTLDWENSFLIQNIRVSGIDAIRHDIFGNIYLAGNLEGSTTFGEIALVGAGPFICKMDSNGKFIYAQKISVLTSPVTRLELEVDSSQNVFIGYSTIDQVDNGIVFNLSKYDVSGALFWNRQINTGASQKISSIVKTDKTGNVYIGGFYSNGAGAIDFDPGTGVTNLPGGTGFLEVLDKNGNFVWVKQVDANINKSFQTSPSGVIYITELQDIATRIVYAIQRINDDGTSGKLIKLPYEKDDALYIDYKENFYLSNFETIKKFDGNANLVLQTKSYSFEFLNFDSKGNMYVSGRFNGTVNFDSTHSLTASGPVDSFLEKIDDQGKIVWVAQTLGAKGTNYTSLSIINAFGIVDSGGIYVVGSIVNNTTGNDDFYIAQYKQCN
jgi:hypothetical protein